MAISFIDTLAFSQRMQKAGLEQKIDLVRKDIETLEHKLTLKLFFMLAGTIAIITWLDKIIT